MSVTDELIGPKGRAFTDEQARAVRERDGDLLLSAAAGSGKTSVLVERFVRHVVEDGIAPGRILAITFTEKAAGELRHRIRERLLELGERDHAREAEGAWISTIHGFCARLLRGHAVAAGLDPQFTVLDETVTRTLRDEAWDRAFAGWLGERGDAALDLAAAFTADGLRAAIEDVFAVLRSQGQTHPRLPRPAAAPAPDPAELLRLRDVAAASLDPGDARVTVLRALDALERCRELLGALAPGQVPGPAVLDQACFKPGSTAALKCDPCLDYLGEHERYATACAGWRGTRAVAELDALLSAYATAYASAKRARSGLDFDDLELLARDLLVSAPAALRATRERFARVMVDEFQDSAPRQVELFDLVGGTGPADSTATFDGTGPADGTGSADRDPGRGTFLVGDELQSIYGFRHADVEVFRARRAELQAADRAAALTRNFRSRAPVLDAVNAAFAARFGEGFRSLVPGRADAHDGAPDVELLITGTDGWDDVDLGALPRAQAWRHAEARLLAQRIGDLVRVEGVAPEDIVVLLRSAGDLPVYERALEEAGLQTLAAGGRGYWGRQVVRDLCAWLAALANPRDEEQLYGVLASPLVGLSTDALALIARAGKGRAWQAVDAAFAEAPPASEAGQRGLADVLAPADRERLAAFHARFVHERDLLPHVGLDEVLRRAVEATDYDLHVLRLPGGARRLANVHKLLRLAADHERVHGRDVRGLVDRANAELEADARETDAPVELGDARAVRLMTIHAAKGLEFPVVCVADLGRRPGGGEPALLVDGDRVGVRLPSIAGGRERALDFTALREDRKAAEAAEEDRVLYVALTRAEERLILSGAVKVDPWPDLGRNGVAPIAWLAPAILGETPTADPSAAEASAGRVRVRCVVSTPATVGTVLREGSLAPAGAELPVAPAPPVRGPVAPPAEPPPAVRTLSYSALSQWKRCGYRFYLQRILGLPEEDLALRRPGPRTDDGGLDPRTRGTIAHEALEHQAPHTTTDALLHEAAERAGVTLSADELDDLRRLVDGFTPTPLARRITQAARVRREHVFTFPLGPALLNGVVDVLAVEDDGTALVVDYKSDRLDPDTDLAALVERDYGVQRRIYALAALEQGHAGCEVAYAFLERPDEPLSTTFTQADAPRLREELAQLAEGVLEGHYEVAPEPHLGLCQGCPGRRAMCSWSEELTGRELPAPAGS